MQKVPLKKDSQSFSDSCRSQAASVTGSETPHGPGQALWYLQPFSLGPLVGSFPIRAGQGSTGTHMHLLHWLPPSAGATKAILAPCLPCLHGEAELMKLAGWVAGVKPPQEVCSQAGLCHMATGGTHTRLGSEGITCLWPWAHRCPFSLAGGSRCSVLAQVLFEREKGPLG